MGQLGVGAKDVFYVVEPTPVEMNGALKGVKVVSVVAGMLHNLALGGITIFRNTN